MRRLAANPVAAWLLPLLVWLGYGVALWHNRVEVDTPAPWPSFSYVDFRDTVWLPTRDMLAGHDPYDVSAYLQRHPAAQEFPIYAPVVLLAGLLFAFLPLSVAQAIWWVVLGAAFAALNWISSRLAGRTGYGVVAALTLTVFLLSPLGRQPASVGQVGVLTGLGAVMALGCRRGPLQIVGIVLALIKPHVGLPLLALLLVQGRGRTALHGVAVAVLASLPLGLLMIAREGGVGAFWRVMTDNLSASAASPYTSAARDESSRLDLAGAMTRAGIDLTDRAETLVAAVALVGSLAIARLAWQAYRADRDHGALRAAWWTAAAVAMVAWMPSELYAFIVALPALASGLAHVLARWPQRGAAAIGEVACVVPLLVPVVHIRPMDELIGNPQLTAPLNGFALAVALLLAGRTAWLSRSHQLSSR